MRAVISFLILALIPSRRSKASCKFIRLPRAAFPNAIIWSVWLQRINIEGTQLSS